MENGQVENNSMLPICMWEAKLSVSEILISVDEVTERICKGMESMQSCLEVRL